MDGSSCERTSLSIGEVHGLINLSCGYALNPLTLREYFLMYNSVEGIEGFGLRDLVPDPDSDSMVEKAA